MVQLFKFCCVGASSTLIDKGIFWILLQQFGARWWTLYTCISFCFGVTNGFYWNRRWTFNAGEKEDGRKQYVKFLMTNLVGLGLNLVITKVFLIMILGHAGAPANHEKTIVILASLCALPIVVIWNFSAARLWTFKTAKQAPNGEGTSTVPPVTSP